MPEALTESFCERCGTRYEFAAPTQLNTLRKTRGLISGLKNYIMSQDALSDAVGDAMRAEETTLASQQLEAFHDSFNFCIDCRQYTCTNCWNDDAGRCRSCVPIPGTDDLRERFEATFHAQHPELLGQNNGDGELDEADLQRRLGVEAWPTTDLAHAEAATADSTGAETPVEAEPEPMLAEADLWVHAPEPGPATVALDAGSIDPSQPVSWEADGAWELLPEPVVAEVEPEVEPEPVVAEVEPEPEPEPVVAEVEPEPEPPQPTVLRPISETLLRTPQPSVPAVEEEAEDSIAAAAHADDPALAARRAQLDLLGLGDPGEGPVSAGRPKVLPYRSRGAAPTPTELAAMQEHNVVAARGTFWEASAREVAGAPSQIGVQACGECGLSLSASARFCRRCGTRQARSA
jgi:hypothetical protein